MRQQGQVILLLILVMTVALAIGLSVVQKSLVDVSTASKVEQSSRAFSAAEAGIEKTLLYPTGSCGAACNINFSDNSSTATVSDAPSIPALATLGKQQEALEFPPLAKEDIAQVWLADPAASLPDCTAPSPPYVCYTRPTLAVYWGSPSSTDKAALELTLVYYDGTAYQSRKWYLDQTPVRNSGFEQVNCTGNYPLAYQCRKILGGFPDNPLPARLMLLRARLLYNVTSQPFAVQANETCQAAPCNDYSLPSQARTIIATGISGETQRKVRVFQLNKVVPLYFNYAIFSAGDILK